LAIGPLAYNRSSTHKNDYKFQGQENEDDFGLNWDSFKWRNHQPDIGRFFNIDPLAEKYVYNSPYAFSENHVTSHVELEGLEKVSINVRHFIPDRRAGAFFRGDNRGFTTSPNVTSRINHQVTVDTQTKEYSASTASSPTKVYFGGTELKNHPSPMFNGAGVEKTAKPDVTDLSVTSDNKAINISSGYHASDPLAPGAPDIDFNNSFSILPDYANGFVTVSGTTSGDQYPAAESFVTDERGNSVFIGVAPAEGNILDSYGTGNKTLVNATVKIATDAKGNFTGVYGSDGKVISLQDHNKKYQQTKPNQ
jgi:RHS repeat-associated protein